MRTIILDGFLGRPSRMRRLGKEISHRSGPAEIWRYESSGLTPIDKLARDLAARLARIDQPVNLVGYSMGGLVCRSAVAQVPSLNVHRAAFLNTPHAGSHMAWALPFLPAIRQMQPGSAFLRELDTHRWQIPTMVVWCWGDLMVVPGWSANWKKSGQSFRSDVPAHIWPVYSPRIHRKVAAFLAGLP